MIPAWRESYTRAEVSETQPSCAFRAQKADRQFNAVPGDKTRKEGSNYQEADCNQKSRMSELFSTRWTSPDGGRLLSFLGGVSGEAEGGLREAAVVASSAGLRIKPDRSPGIPG